MFFKYNMFLCIRLHKGIIAGLNLKNDFYNFFLIMKALYNYRIYKEVSRKKIKSSLILSRDRYLTDLDFGVFLSSLFSSTKAETVSVWLTAIA